MTSGQFHSIEVSSITVDRTSRQRREITDVDELADSIRRLGLIHPLVIRRDHSLVTGERRLNAVRTLGWTHVSCQFTDEVDIRVLKAIELEENVKRRDVPWQDQVKALQEFHALHVQENPAWTQEQTAEAIGYSPRTIARLLGVAKEISEGNIRVIEAPKLSTAVGIFERARERRNEQEMERFRSTGFAPAPAPAEPESILIEDFNTWVDLPWEGPRFNFIHCDFPYGIDADKFNQGGAPSHGGYTDTAETWERLMDSLSRATHLLMTPSAHLMFWFAMRRRDERLYEPTATALERMGWTINPMPLIWMKTDGQGIIPDPERGPRQIYETCLLGSRGDRKIVASVANAYGAPTVRDRHMSEKPEPMLRHFFRMLVDENTVLLDPTCGSGSALRAAEASGARFTLGLEANQEFAERARAALRSARNLRKAEKVNAKAEVPKG